MTMPSIFLSHGGPNVVTDPSEARDFLTRLSKYTGKPRAIVIMSAHFETSGPAVVADPAPPMIYDFGGFAPELYEMVYPAPGNPELAGEVFDLLDQAGLAPQLMQNRGYDHGTWTTMKLAFPDADIPIVQVSVDPSRDAAYHYSVGHALAPLREQDVLIIGTGHITHNLRNVFMAMRHGMVPDAAMKDQVSAFTDWFAGRFAEGDRDSILQWREKAPHVRENHPTDEHLMPLFFAYGAGGENPQSERIHASRQFEIFAWDSWKFH